MIFNLLVIFGHCVFAKDGFWLNCVVDEFYKNEETIEKPIEDQSEKLEFLLLSAFEYQYEILITTRTNRESEKRPVYCHYFDSEKNKIPDSQYLSFFSSSATVSCPKRPGTVFVSLFGENVTFIEHSKKMVELIDRTGNENPAHQVGVCVGLTHEDQLRFIESFLDDNIDLGASFFYIAIAKSFSESANFKIVIEDYQERGLIELQVFDDNQKHFEMYQLHDCYFRSRHHSKWVVNMSLKERLKMKNDLKLVDYLESIPKDIGQLKLNSYDDNNAIRVTRTIFQPENIEEPDLFIKMSWKLKTGFADQSVPKEVGYLTKIEERERYF